ncbi:MULTISPECIES: acetyl-CoA carboxylase biotin carboxyl carrier protein subunit [unclassified Rhizobium]|uniref:acetyl-CoA carboxylase biotin carboxyl carrier protein n=1 Tax=unclassified Rhizobium TaxID=2613769 RepID=UPI0024791890|nr:MULTISPECIES: acetyl-CoA carboxylase biotin carboxyl carrier protein subunit [unclassified Rhizobium]MDH7803842.1 acetyl-CoA carboxylase biotin carboxyl carrier protein [Rhizobium sp. AN70]
MDLPKIKTLIDFVGRTNVTELMVTEKNVTVRIFKTALQTDATSNISVTTGSDALSDEPASGLHVSPSATSVLAPIFGILHRASAPGQPSFVEAGDTVEEGQTLFIIEAMKVFNKIVAPRAGRITYLTEVDGGEVEVNDLLAEIS